MFLGYQEKIVDSKIEITEDESGGEIISQIPITEEFIAGIANTREELENNDFVKYTRIEETEEEYKLFNGSYMTVSEAFEKAKEAKRAETNQSRDEAEQGGFEYLGKVFDSDQVSCIRMSSAAQAMQYADDTATITWTTQDNSTIDLNKSQLMGLVVALAQHSNECHQKATELKAQIDACESQEELDAIQWVDIVD